MPATPASKAGCKLKLPSANVSISSNISCNDRPSPDTVTELVITLLAAIVPKNVASPAAVMDTALVHAPVVGSLNPIAMPLAEIPTAVCPAPAAATPSKTASLCLNAA